MTCSITIRADRGLYVQLGICFCALHEYWGRFLGWDLREVNQNEIKTLLKDSNCLLWSFKSLFITGMLFHRTEKSVFLRHS